MSSTVRPRMTGLIVFGSRIVSAATGFVFLVMVARWLAPAQLGLWEFIVDLIVFASYPAGFLTYWAARDVARGKVVGKTTLVLNLLASMLGVAIFLAFALASYSEVGSSVGPFILAVVLVPLSYWNQATSALVGGYNPAIGAYSLLASEPAKLIAAYPLLFVFKLRIEGVIIAIAVSYFVQAAVSTYQLRVVSSERVDFALGRKWLRDPYVPGLMTLTYVLGIADTFAAYPHVGRLLPAMGYGREQMEELRETIARSDADLVLIGTPIDLRRLIELDKPALRVTYKLQEIGEPTLKDLLGEKGLLETALV